MRLKEAFRLERIFQSIKLMQTSLNLVSEFRLERIFQSIKLNLVPNYDEVMFRLERIFQSIKLAKATPPPKPSVPARAHFPID